MRLFAQDSSDKQIVIEGNNAFALNLYAELSKEEGNLFFSPSSISTALAMTYAGARGNTATQMANTLHFTLSQERLHPAFSELMKDLEADPQRSDYQLSIANALWGQTGYKFYDEFMNITKSYYDAGFKEVDFKNKTEETRQIINSWTEDKTNNKIKDLIKPGILNNFTRLVLTNAIYFKGKWQFQFDAKNTQNSTFTLLNGEEIQVPMMKQTKEFNYIENGMLQIIEMPYVGDKLSMVILLPKKIDGLKQIEGSLTQGNLNNWLSNLRNREVIVSLPKFKMTSEFELNEVLKSLGMVDAFTMQADFSGMTPDPIGLYISNVLHKAFVDVNEEGTEAAAATAVVMKLRGIMPEPKPVFRADHPFIFIIRDMQSGSILFMGRVTDPR
jgi:serpin B